MFARLNFSTFLVCCSEDLSDNESEEKPSVAICGGSICILTGLYRSWHRKISKLGLHIMRHFRQISENVVHSLLGMFLVGSAIHLAK